MQPQSPPGSHFVKDTCTELQERTLETGDAGDRVKKNKYKQCRNDTLKVHQITQTHSTHKILSLGARSLEQSSQIT